MGVILDSSVLIAAERGKLDLEELLRTHATEIFQIAAITAAALLHGCELGYAVATRNVAEFQRVPNLRLLDVAPFAKR